jgi:hypothetical protein
VHKKFVIENVMCMMSSQSEVFAMKITSTILSINIFLGNVKSFILGDHGYLKHKHFEVLSDVLFSGSKFSNCREHPFLF